MKQPNNKDKLFGYVYLYIFCIQIKNNNKKIIIMDMLDELMAIGNRDVREEDETMSLDTVLPSPIYCLPTSTTSC